MDKERVCCISENVACRALITTVTLWIVFSHSKSKAIIVPSNTRLDIDSSHALAPNALEHIVCRFARIAFSGKLWSKDLVTGHRRFRSSGERHWEGGLCEEMVNRLSSDFGSICFRKTKEMTDEEGGRRKKKMLSNSVKRRSSSVWASLSKWSTSGWLNPHVQLYIVGFSNNGCCSQLVYMTVFNLCTCIKT